MAQPTAHAKSNWASLWVRPCTSHTHMQPQASAQLALGSLRRPPAQRATAPSARWAGPLTSLANKAALRLLQRDAQLGQQQLQHVASLLCRQATGARQHAAGATHVHASASAEWLDTAHCTQLLPSFKQLGPGQAEHSLRCRPCRRCNCRRGEPCPVAHLCMSAAGMPRRGCTAWPRTGSTPTAAQSGSPLAACAAAAWWDGARSRHSPVAQQLRPLLSCKPGPNKAGTQHSKRNRGCCRRRNQQAGG